MALTGQLSDLSLAELIEFFCNQRKTGRLEVTYAVGAGYFYLKSGAVIHAHFGDLRGIDAVYYALTQSNASFTFSSTFEAPEHSINQPWTSVVLEGLRRMDEGIIPPSPSVTSFAEVSNAVQPSIAEADPATPSVQADNPTTRSNESPEDVKAFGVLLSSSENNSFAPRRWRPAMVVAAVVLLFAVVGVPWAVYTRQKATRLTSQPSTAVTTPSPADVAVSDEAQTNVSPEIQPAADADAAEIARRQREARIRERARLEQETANAGANADAPKPVATPSGNAPSSPVTSNKRATVHVTYDENGRVTAASGGDPTALRIARQKRFPPGKPGSATITIPIN